MAPLRSLTVLGLIAFGLMTSPASAGDLNFQFNGDDYKIMVTGATWAAASAVATQTVVNGIRGHLCIIDSTEENAAIFNAMTTAGVDTVASQGGGAIYGWLGGSDDPASIPEASEGVFFWVDGFELSSACPWTEISP